MIGGPVQSSIYGHIISTEKRRRTNERFSWSREPEKMSLVQETS